MLQSFDDYRDRMLSIMDNVEPRLGHRPPADSDLLDLGRARMARIVTAYHMFAERELFGPRATDNPAHRLRVRAMAAECAKLAQDFRAFTRECAANPVIPRWANYRLESLAMIGRIRKHLAEAETVACQGIEVPPAPPVVKRAAPGYRTAA